MGQSNLDGIVQFFKIWHICTVENGIFHKNYVVFKWNRPTKMEKNNAESANLFLFLNDLLSYGSRISEFASEC